MIRSHIVPRLYLEQFAVKASRSAKWGHLWVYQQNSVPRRGTSKSEGAENGYFAYPLPSGSLNESLEGVLAQIEDRFANILVGLSIGRFAPTLANRRVTAEYVGLMFARSRGRLAGTAWIQSKVSALLHELDQDNFLHEISVAASKKYNATVTREQLTEIVKKLAEGK